MSGYYRYSMSNNALDAYDNGERPLSKWTKTEIMEMIEQLEEEGVLTLSCSKEKLKKVPVKKMKDVFLYYTSWHHTSKHYNQTDFYSLDIEYLEELTDEKIEELIADYKSEMKLNKKEKVEEICETWECSYLEWGGTRKHPRAKTIVEIGIIKGNWFHKKDGHKKYIHARGFYKIRKIEND